ncbi:MAG: RtcB family protein [Bryobacteraceae bacterium]
MSEAALYAWLSAPMRPDVSEAVERLRHAPDVQHVAVMPDVHLSSDICVGVATGTTHLLYPQAVGGDIGCGMLAVASNLHAPALRDASRAGRVLAALGRDIPARRRNRRERISQPRLLIEGTLSHPLLEAIRRGEGELEFATLGSGNHFIELQSDEDERLWLMIHSGSRALGQAIHAHHLARAQPAAPRLRAIDAASDEGAAYLHDLSYARRYADASRRAMAEAVGRVLQATLDWDAAITTDHNHVLSEFHMGRPYWVHRKGAARALLGEPGVLPGSMGTLSFHVEGRGHPPALCSSAHGAGRALSRTEARAKLTTQDLHRQMEGVWYDFRLSDRLRDEAPAAYKDIRAVLRAQKELVKVVRTLRPILNYKGT